MLSGGIQAWLAAFAITYLIETAVVVPMTRGGARAAALCLFAQLATHPIVWFVIPQFRLAYTPTVAIAEAWAFAAEGAFYTLVFPDLGWRRAFVISLAANAASFGIGELLYATGVL